MSFAQWGADALEGLNPWAELQRRAEERQRQRQEEERQRRERERREREADEADAIRRRLNAEDERVKGQAQQSFQLWQAGANNELGRHLKRDNNSASNAKKIINVSTEGAVRRIGADYEGQIGLNRADYEGKNSVITNLLEGQDKSQTSRQNFARDVLGGYQAHERGVLGQLVGATPALEQINSTYLAGLDRAIAADERLQAAERPLRWAGLVLPTTAALAAALIR